MSRGVVSGSTTTITRASMLVSKINGVAGRAKIELSGTAQVRFIQSDENINDLVNAAPFRQRMLEAVKADNYTLTKADAGVVIVLSKTSAIVYASSVTTPTRAIAAFSGGRSCDRREFGRRPRQRRVHPPDCSRQDDQQHSRDRPGRGCQ